MSTPPDDGRPYYVVLGRPKTANAYSAVVEHSFSMDESPDRCLIFWSSTEARSGMLEALVGSSEPIKLEIDGHKEAIHYRDHFNDNRRKQGLDDAFEVYDARDPELPIDIDWEAYARDNEPAETLSGVRNKFKARNALFVMRDDR